MQTLKRGLELLEQVILNGPKSIEELGTILGVGRSSVSRMLGTLRDLGYVKQISGRKYAADLRTIELSGRILAGMETLREAIPYLVDLVTRTQCGVYIGTLWRGRMVICYHVATDDVPPWKTGRGWFGVPLHASSMAKVILGTMPDDHVRKLIGDQKLPVLTKWTITDPEKLIEELHEVRELGFAVSNQEHTLGMRSIAAPIRNYKGEVTASVALGGRIEEENMKQYASLVIRTSRQISFALGYNSDGLLVSSSSESMMTHVDR